MDKTSKYYVCSVLLLAGVLPASAVQGSGGVVWGYSGQVGPEHWGELNPQYSVCDAGNNQSPINLTSFIEADLEPLSLHYSTEAKEVLNNGHSVQVNYAPGSILMMAGQEYELQQIHFHVPSENIIAGQSFPMEGHLVHVDSKGELAVIGVICIQRVKNMLQWLLPGNICQALMEK